MAGLSEQERDLDAVAGGLKRWWQARPGVADVRLSPLEANQKSGFSSQSLLFELSYEEAGASHEAPYVLRLPPAGGGLFPEYDLARQAMTQDLVAGAGIPAASPAIYEPDPQWIGTDFLVMPRITGHIPSDFFYAIKGWMHAASHPLQRACYASFVDMLIALHTLEIPEVVANHLARPNGVGLQAEIDWWARYLDWASDGTPDTLMSNAYEWARRTAPDSAVPDSLTWGDPRFANTVFDDDGRLVGVLDWEQAAIGPAELDVGWWLATRRQACEVLGVTVEPELPGFLTRDQTIARVEAGLGRRLDGVDWHETFAMVRMGTCIVALKRLVRRLGLVDHFAHAAQPLTPWARDRIEAGY